MKSQISYLTQEQEQNKIVFVKIKCVYARECWRARVGISHTSKSKNKMWWFQFFSSCLVLLILVQLVRIALSDCDLLLSLYARGKGRNLAALRGKVVWITGASSGIGEELAYSLAGLGSKLILSARREAELQSVLDHCKSKIKML